MYKVCMFNKKCVWEYKSLENAINQFVTLAYQWNLSDELLKGKTEETSRPGTKKSTVKIYKITSYTYPFYIKLFKRERGELDINLVKYLIQGKMNERNKNKFKY